MRKNVDIPRGKHAAGAHARPASHSAQPQAGGPLAAASAPAHSTAHSAFASPKAQSAEAAPFSADPSIPALPAEEPVALAPLAAQPSPLSRDQWSRPAKKKKHKVLKRVLIAIAVLLVLLAGAAGGYYLYLRNVIGYKGDMEALLRQLVDPDYEEPFYVLVIGSDGQGGYTAGERSDIMCLVRVDLNEPQLTLVSVPRDTQYTYPDGTIGKLNGIYDLGGTAAIVEAVTKVTGRDIAHVVLTQFDGLEKVVDDLGNITVDVPYEIYVGGQHFAPGKQEIDGQQALLLARERKQYGAKIDNGFSEDSVRQRNVRNIMIGIMNKTLEAGAAELPQTIMNVASIVQTDIPLETLVGWALKLKDAGAFKIYSTTGPYEGQLWSAHGDQWLTYDDPQAWAQLMEVVDSGVDPSTVIETKTTSDGKMTNQETKHLVVN